MATQQETREMIFEMLSNERDQQDKKWSFPRHDLSPTDWITILAEEVGEASDEALSYRFQGLHKVELIDELVQAGAVCVSILEHILMNQFALTTPLGVPLPPPPGESHQSDQDLS